MPFIRFWRLRAAEQETVETVTRPVCTTGLPFGSGGGCGERPYYVLTWDINESGLPGMGDRRHDFVCAAHVERRLSAIPFEYVGSVLITPYKETH